jgi:hypothetical protein
MAGPTDVSDTEAKTIGCEQFSPSLYSCSIRTDDVSRLVYMINSFLVEIPAFL